MTARSGHGLDFQVLAAEARCEGAFLFHFQLFRPIETRFSRRTQKFGQADEVVGRHGEGESDLAKVEAAFTFEPGFNIDRIHGFTATGPNHDTLSLPHSDFTGLADVLHNTHNTGFGVAIFDPANGDLIRIAGITKHDLVANKQGFQFHA